MLLMFVVLTAIGIVMVGGWRLSTAVRHRWYTMVTIPRIVRRECMWIDEEYRELLFRPHHRPR